MILNGSTLYRKQENQQKTGSENLVENLPMVAHVPLRKSLACIYKSNL